MKYLGIYSKQNLSDNNTHLLLTYVGDVDVIINYNIKCPFYIEQIAVLLDRKEDKEFYDVFECEISASTDDEAKAYAWSFAENLIRYRQNFKEYYNKCILDKEQ